MGRWKPPGKPASPYITPAGYRALEAEAKTLWARRNVVVKHLAAAAAEGDRSENAEYIYRKKELREIDRRIGYLQRRMPKLEIVAEAPADRTRVFFGATVELEGETGTLACYRIVGSDETDPAGGAISVDAPVARALLGRALDDEITLPREGGPVAWTIVDIRYEPVAPE